MNQCEWRVALYRSYKCTDAYKLDVGDLSDIVRCFKTTDIQDGIDSCLKRHMYCDTEGWYGTVNRREMGELFYHLGDGKTTMFSVIG